MKTKIKAIIALVLLLPTLPVGAAVITSSWSGAGSGTLSWQDSANWTPVPYPNNGANTYITSIGDATGDRVIQTSGSITVSRLKITQTSASGTNTLKLGGNLTLANNAGGQADNAFVNSTNDATKLVIDLGGHTFATVGAPGTGLTNATSYTLTGGGVYQTDQFYNNSSGGIVVGAGVTVKATSTLTQSVFRTIWNSSATFQYAANSTTLATITGRADATYAFGNLVIGDANNTVASNANLTNTSGSGVTVQGNVNILTYVGAGGASAKLSIGSGILNVRGNFIDQGTDSFTYGTGTIILEGGIGTERTLSTGRADLTTSFKVGRSVTSPGNIALGQDLVTTGSFTVLKESRLDVNTFRLAAGDILIESTATKPTVDFTFGQSEAGLIDAGGLLTLNLATINVTYDGSGWINGSDLTLFEFNSLSGTPNLTVNIFGAFSYDAVVVGPNSIYLDNVQVVPEPGSACLVLVAAGLLLYRRRKIGQR